MDRTFFTTRPKLVWKTEKELFFTSLGGRPVSVILTSAVDERKQKKYGIKILHPFGSLAMPIYDARSVASLIEQLCENLKL